MVAASDTLTDKKLILHTGRGVSPALKRLELTWGEFHENLRHPLQSELPIKTYLQADRATRTKDKAKAGYYVLADFHIPRRSNNNVATRWGITVDIDDPSLARDILDGPPLPTAHILHTTRSHTPASPRVRLIFPFTRGVTPSEWDVVLPLALQSIFPDGIPDGIDWKATASLSQPMFWPVVSPDQEYICRFHNQAQPIQPDYLLEEFDLVFGGDLTALPSPINTPASPRSTKDLEDPRDKPFPIGAFCRKFSIHDAITTFLHDVYERIDDDRYHYIPSSSAPGVLTYDDLWAYSHHASDPASGRLWNAFDLVRAHRFGHLDEGLDYARTPPPDWPSTRRMEQLLTDKRRASSSSAPPGFSARLVDELREEEGLSRTERLLEALDEEEAPNSKVIPLLDLSKAGLPRKSEYNIRLILENDPRFQGLLYRDLRMPNPRVDEEQLFELTGDLIVNPTVELVADEITRVLTAPIEKGGYDMVGVSKQRVLGQLLAISSRVSSVRNTQLDFMRAVLPEWDGTSRLETWLIKTTRIADTPYHRWVSRLLPLAIVARTHAPGIPLPYMPVLCGPQGCGKSEMLARLALDQDFFLTATHHEWSPGWAVEYCWDKVVVESAELQSYHKSEMEALKAFISATHDRHRMPYAREAVEVPRGFVVIGTTNTPTIYRDITGERRVLLIRTMARRYDWGWFNANLHQILAEALHRWEEHASRKGFNKRDMPPFFQMPSEVRREFEVIVSGNTIDTPVMVLMDAIKSLVTEPTINPTDLFPSDFDEGDEARRVALAVVSSNLLKQKILPTLGVLANDERVTRATTREVLDQLAARGVLTRLEDVEGFTGRVRTRLGRTVNAYIPTTLYERIGGDQEEIHRYLQQGWWDPEDPSELL